MNTQLLKYLSYFDIFNHPLSLNELSLLSGKKEQEIKKDLAPLVTQGICFQQDDYFATQSNIAQLIEERVGKEAAAQKYFKKLNFYGKLIRLFPFVSAFGISGSLSKNVMHADGDIDYFIITKPGRLWICRTFLVAFKKLFLFNSKKYFCVNYFVDEENLLIPDKNIFTAIEVSHLLPVYNAALIAEFKSVNKWSDELVSAFKHPVKVTNLKGKSWMSKMVEFPFKGKLGDKFDLYLMRFTYKKWTKKFKDFDATKLELTMRTNRGVSKHHPRDFQNKVLKAYQERLNKLNIEP